MGRIKDYAQAREWAVKENLQDLGDALRAGLFEEVIHFLGLETTSVLSQRAQLRRAYCRQVARGLNPVRPQLPKIEPGVLRVS